MDGGLKVLTLPGSARYSPHHPPLHPSKVWHCLDVRFDVPKVIITARVASPACHESPLGAALTDLTVRLIRCPLLLTMLLLLLFLPLPLLLFLPFF